MIRSTTSRREQEPTSLKPSTSGVGKRRVLGDITNSTSNDEVRSTGLGKKAVVVPAAMVLSEEATVSDRPYMQRPSDDIDARDVGNPVLVSTYVDEMYEHFGDSEKKYMVNSNYMASQPYVNERMRTILVDWLVEVHLKFKMVPETLYLTVNIIDRYLELKQVRRSKLQLVGVSSLLLAAKYEEIYPPELRDLVFITDRAYTKQEIVEMESEVVNTLQYNLTVPTVHTFLCRYLKAAHADRTMVQMACYLAERSLQEHSTLKYLPSTVAATAVLIARKSLKRHPWSPTLVTYTKYDEPDLVGCCEDMRTALTNQSCQQQAVHKKYSSPKFGGVAKLALFF